MVFFLRRLFSLFLLAAALLPGCSYAHRADQVNYYFSPEKIGDTGEFPRIRKVVFDINRRSGLRKKSPEWLKEAYSSLKIRKLDEVRPKEYKKYRKYVDPKDPRVYIIIHPAYYAFFMNQATLSSSSDLDGPPAENIVERFCSRRSFYNFELRVMQEQERLLKDFLEVASAEKRLVILVLPRDYKAHLSYGYLNGLDEYVRYINEVTNMSDSVLYLESMEYQNGYVGEADLKVLSSFIEKLGVKKIMLGGGFAGRCLDNFYSSLLRKFDYRDIYIVPEITALPRDDVAGLRHGRLFTGEGTINFRETSRSLSRIARSNDYKNPQQIRHLYIYEPTADGLRQVN